jgi:hypothetical protein
VRGRARQKLNALLASKLATARAWDLKETFRYFWHYKSVIWAGAFLDLLPSDAEPSGADEKGGPHAARTRAADPELVSGERRNLHWGRGGTQ